MKTVARDADIPGDVVGDDDLATGRSPTGEQYLWAERVLLGAREHRQAGHLAEGCGAGAGGATANRF